MILLILKLRVIGDRLEFRFVDNVFLFFILFYLNWILEDLCVGDLVIRVVFVFVLFLSL